MIDLIASPYQIEDIEKLKDAGASSVIIGSPFFSVRSISHFTHEEVKAAKALCKKLKMQCYYLLNRFFVEDELSLLKEELLFLKQLDMDGIYFGDMGVFYEAQQLGMQHKMVYNPDTILTNSADIIAYMELGMKMCTLSKEITLEEMLKIAKKANCELEVILHGRLHMMHSKRKLLTHYMQFLKRKESLANRYDLYLKEEHREEHMPIVEDEQGTHIFTGFTLCSFEEMEDIINAGISHLRIESMFYTIEEICAIVRDYQAVYHHLKNGREQFQYYEKQYPKQNITKGFLYKKTGLLK